MKYDYVGWQIGINYQAPEPRGVTLDYVKDVIDRSSDSGMNFISFMMLSYACFCPEHDGYAWPVKNTKLEPLRDAACLNSNPRTEFVRKALAYAKGKGFHCQLMMNSMIWNPAKVAEKYPRACPQSDARGNAGNGWLFCPDSPDGWQLALDEVIDLLEFYADSPVDSFAFERMGYDGGRCYCPYSQAKFKADTDLEPGASPLSRLIWKGNSARKLLQQYAGVIRRVRPGIGVWAHTGGEPEWGHFPQVLKAVGADMVSNHGQHFLPTRKAFYQQLDWLEPLPCVPHICVRDLPTANYPVPLKTPGMIREYASWLEGYPGDRVKGAMFFNEVRTTERIKQTVYEIVKGWRG